MMRAGLEFADIGKVEVLRDEKAPRCLRRRPHIGVVVSCQSLLRHRVRIVIQGCEFGDQ